MSTRSLLPLVFAVFLAFPSLAGQSDPRFGQRPPWALQYTVDATLEKSQGGATGGTLYLLVVSQENLATRESFHHLAIKILNTEGVQSASDISATFDPTFQGLTFCSLAIHRDGKEINRWNREPIQTYRRATSPEMHTYDRSMEATIHLRDVRAGDIVEYSYVISGYVPTYQGRFFASFFLNYSVAVSRMIVRILSPGNRPLAFRAINDPPDPLIRTTAGFTEYLWDLRAQKPIISDSHTPSWYNPYQAVYFSGLPTWGEVARWAAPMYDVSNAELLNVSRIRPPARGGDQKREILETIRFVQDEIRYVSVLSGLSAHRPTSPGTVLARRYGDCKDKSLLLVTLLQARGVSARPVLVNTGLCSHVNEYLPSPSAFDHCIVTLSVDGRTYFVDPTISNQGGSLDGFYFPPYEAGLVIDRGTTGLSVLSSPMVNAMSITERYTSRDLNGPASFHVRTAYSGKSADRVRTIFKTTPIENIQKIYTDFYKYLFPAISSTEKPRIVEDERWGVNRFVVEEDYSIADFWHAADSDSTVLTCELRPLVLDEYVRVPDAGSRTSPYALGDPISIRVDTDVELPEEWSAKIEPEEIQSDAFVYRSRGTHFGNYIGLHHEYDRLKDQVSAEAFPEYVTKHEKIGRQISLTLSFNTALKGFSLSWISVVIVVLVVATGVYGARRIYREYDPPARGSTPGRNIGGWLILLAVGLYVSPVSLAVDLFRTQSFFDANIIAAQQGWAIPLVIWLELALNTGFLVTSIFTAVLLNRRRTSFPRVFTIYMGSFLAFHVVDLLVVTNLLGNEIAAKVDVDSVTAILRIVIASAVWISYVWVSERARETFVVRRGGAPLPLGVNITCPNCSTELQLDSAEIQAGRYVCPTCGHEGSGPSSNPSIQEAP